MLLRTLLALVIFAAISLGSAFEVSPDQAIPGDELTLTGSASPGELLSFSSSFSMDLPVEDGQYSYETRIKVPQTPNRFTVKATNVQDLNAGLKLGIWISKGFEAKGGKISLSKANIPAGSYSLKVFGQAQEGATTVVLDVIAETEVKADEKGAYSLVMDTSGIPSGEYTIEGAGETKIVPISSQESSVVQPETEKASQSVPSTQSTPESKSREKAPPQPQSKPAEKDIVSNLLDMFGISI